MKLTRIALLGTLGLLAACGDSGPRYTPIVDGTPGPAFRADLTDCQALARNQKQFDQETGAAAALGAGAGALLAKADDEDALGGALAGALAGGVAGAVEANDKRQAIVIACMKGRGHAVVG